MIIVITDFHDLFFNLLGLLCIFASIIFITMSLAFSKRRDAVFKGLRGKFLLYTIVCFVLASFCFLSTSNQGWRKTREPEFKKSFMMEEPSPPNILCLNQ